MGKMVKLHYDLLANRRYYAGKHYEIRNDTIHERDKFNRETVFSLNSHVGTHIDYPAHVFQDGFYGDHYDLDYLCSKKVECVEFDCLCLTRPSITIKNVSEKEISKDCEILLIKTGFCEVRDLDCYWEKSPVVDADLPLYLKEEFPLLRAVCFDIISLTSQIDKPEGRKCHLNFLSDNLIRPILVIEDVDMKHIFENTFINEIFIVPLYYKNMDGALCTIIAGIE